MRRTPQTETRSDVYQRITDAGYGGIWVTA
jgi:hypothetical protein